MLNPLRILAPTVAALALAAPGAQARPAVDPPVPGGAAAVVSSPAPVGDGFDWGSAAIGAGGVAGLVALLSAGAAVARRDGALSAR